MSDNPFLKKKGRMRITVHPLFLLFGVWFAFTGKLFLFLSAAVVALIHEYGHALAAARVGYGLDRIVLMPYGALISGDLEGVGLKDEIFIALAGPLINAACAVLFVALWWFFPDTYPYTDVAVYSSASIAVINLLPAYPLDGGRILYCTVAKFKGEKAAAKIARGAGFVFAALILALFIYGCFRKPNFTMLFFALFIAFGAAGGRECRYSRIRYQRPREMKRGMEIRRIAVGTDCPVKRVLAFMQRGKYLEISLYDESGEFCGEFSQEEFLRLLETANLYEPIGVAMQKAGKM